MIRQTFTMVVMLAIGIAAGVWLSAAPSAEHQHDEEAAVYRCPMHPTIVTDRPGSCLVCGMDLVKDGASGTDASRPETSSPRQVAFWRAPMDPNFVSDEPGKSPMGMDLIPVYEDDLAAAGAVQIDPVTVQNIGVRTVVVERRQLSRNIRAVGRVDYDETRMSDLNTKVAGWVEKLYVDYTGQQVAKGQKLLEIYSPELVAAQEEYLTAVDYNQRLQRGLPTGQQSVPAADALQGAVHLVNAAAQRLRNWDITEGQISELKSTHKVKRRMTIYSPQQGIVVHKAVFDGAHIKRGEHLYRIGDVDTVWVYADIYEFELPWIRQGQEAAVDLAYLPGKLFRGRVTYVYPYVDPKTRTVKVRMNFANPDLDLKPEMYANVNIASAVAHDAIAVPGQAVIRSGERNVVVVALGNGKFQPREVRLGVETSDQVQVLEGLREGEQIVVSGQFLIDSESNLKAAVRAMGAVAAAGGRPGEEEYSAGR